MNARRLSFPMLAIALVVACSDDQDSETGATDSRLLHVPSPDWRDQVIYFVMIDRFEDGDPSNNDQGAVIGLEEDPDRTEFFPPSNAAYSGGDLKGIQDRLDYIEELGATAVWITPPVANQWWDKAVNFGGYHGYWARDFTRVDEHYGTMEDYKNLSDALHQRGMYLIQDIVVNHTGNFFRWEDPANPDEPGNQVYDPANPRQFFQLNQGSLPRVAPDQSPFDLNDLSNPDHEAADIYHWTPEILDFMDRNQELEWSLSDLDDLNTTNPVVRDALRESYAKWVREVGVDGFRVDTVKFIEHDFYTDFFHSTDPDRPGIDVVAAETGRDDFFSFGEVFETSAPFDDAGDVKALSYLGTPEAPELDAILGFPLYEDVARLFAEGRPTSVMTYRLERFMDYPDPFRTPNFIDNHDVRRFSSIAGPEAVRQALLFLFTVPGIPVIWQGTEQGFTDVRRAMFGGGYLSDEDQFDTESNQFAYVKSLIELRQQEEVLRRGALEVLYDTRAGPGPLVYERRVGEDRLLVLFNSSNDDVLAARVEAGLQPYEEVEIVLSQRFNDTIRADGQGRLTLELPGRAAVLVRPTGRAGTPDGSEVTITVDPGVDGMTFDGEVVITGQVSPPDTQLRAVLNNRLDRAFATVVQDDGRFEARIRALNFPFGPNQHSVIMYAARKGVAAERIFFRTDIPFTGKTIVVDDPTSDDVGPDGVYTYPLNFDTRSMDVEQVTVKAAISTLIVTFKMTEEISTIWGPPNGFDHVAFTTFIDLADRDGRSVLPLLDAQAPDGFAWDLTHFAFGWSNAVYSAQGATPENRGEPLAGAPLIEVNEGERTVSFTFSGPALGVSSFENARLYLTTWDFDGIDNIYRKLRPDGGPWEVGGGAADAPKIMDDVGPIEIGTIE
jgi:glycosidase